MVNIAYRVLLTFNATSLLLIIFSVHKKVTLDNFFPSCNWLLMLPDFASYLAYLAVPISLTWVSIYLSVFLGRDEFKKGEVKSIEHANNSFLPSYLGYFFVALSVSSWETLWFVYSVIFVFTFLSQALYFNPLFLLFGYEFYNMNTESGAEIFLISSSRYKNPSDVEISRSYRINDYIFMER
ncbi:hypothetical protein [Halomonas sp.]|uniref:hypothetical protein n=1 Tax=Halomonas sp. TaxID=1486246 RepID=UPI0035666052